MKKIIIFVAALLLVSTISVHAGNIILVANKDVASTALSRDEIQRIFLGKKTTWEDGKQIVPITQNGGKVQEEFLGTILKKSAAQYDSYWKQAVFTGTGLPPKSFGNDEDVVQFVEKTGGAIGYIDSDSPHGSLKKIDLK